RGGYGEGRTGVPDASIASHAIDLHPSRDATRPTAAPLWTKNPSIHRGSTGRPSLRRDGHAPVAQPLPTPPPSWRTSQPGWRTKGAKISPITSEKSPNREGVSANRRGGLR